MNILLVDDDEVDRLSMKRMLTRSPVATDIIEIDNGHDTIRAIRTNQFDIVLLDFQLSDMTGLELLNNLRGKFLGATAIIVVTGQQNDTLAEQCIEAGAQDFILKDEVSPNNINRALHFAKLRHENEMELRKSHDMLQRLAERDQLTGLLNRYSFETKMSQAIDDSRRSGEVISLLLLDIDNFKRINDFYGHESGDKIIQELALRLRFVCRFGDLLCRLGGDEFAILATQASSDKAFLIAERVFEQLAQPFIIFDNELSVNCSVGIATIDKDSDSPQDTFKRADLAMYCAKEKGQNSFHYFSDELQTKAERRIQLESELRIALEQQQFEVYFQPKLDNAGEKIVGAEALVRWIHPERGIIAPGDFLDIAQECDLIFQIDDFVLQSACQTLNHWRKSFLSDTPFKMAVNLTTSQLLSDNFSQKLSRVLHQYRINPSDIELEIVENELMSNYDKAIKVIRGISNMGASIAIDDFGTGYSSLSYLKALPVQTLKIDRSFLQGVPSSEPDARLLKALIQLALTMNYYVVVEGVETKQQLEFCNSYGAHSLQGFFFSKPIDAEAFEQLYQNYLTSNTSALGSIACKS